MGNKNRHPAPIDVDAVSFNNHYALVSTDHFYQPIPNNTSVASSISHSPPFNEQTIFHILDHLKHTATGIDDLPAWFLRLGAPIFAKPLAVLFNQSLASSTVPVQWKTSVIRPIPKIPIPKTLSDYRPISITPVLSRTLERLVVSSYIYPALTAPNSDVNIQHQYAFRPTGSSTSALISILQTVTDMLETQPYVRVIALDFSKAFDTVRHSTLVDKLSKLNLPDHIFKWITDFLNNRSHCTLFNNSTSPFAKIDASVIQGSAMGPVLYSVTASDLESRTHGNEMRKFADDT